MYSHYWDRSWVISLSFKTNHSIGPEDYLCQFLDWYLKAWCSISRKTQPEKFAFPLCMTLKWLQWNKQEWNTMIYFIFSTFSALLQICILFHNHNHDSNMFSYSINNFETNINFAKEQYMYGSVSKFLSRNLRLMFLNDN